MAKKNTVKKSPARHRHYHLIPGHARGTPDDSRSTFVIDWVETPQGPIEFGCEQRLHTLYSKGTRSPDALVAELVRIAERAIAISRGALPIEPKAKPLTLEQAHAKVNEVLSGKATLHKGPTIEEMLAYEPKEITLKSIKPSVELPDQLLRMGNYLDSGDITHIVPAGSFQSREEKKAWDKFVTVDIHQFGPSSIKGKQSLRCTRVSNGSGGPLLASSTVQLVKGTCVVEVDKENVIVECIAVDPKDAKFLFGPFNSLFRKKF